MSPELTTAMRQWEHELEAETVRLIEHGIRPDEARARAREIITERRRLAAMKGSR